MSNKIDDQPWVDNFHKFRSLYNVNIVDTGKRLAKNIPPPPLLYDIDNLPITAISVETEKIIALEMREEELDNFFRDFGTYVDILTITKKMPHLREELHKFLTLLYLYK